MTELLGIPMLEAGRQDIYSGVARLAGKVWASHVRPEGGSKTVVAVVHPTSNFLGHYLLEPLAARGVATVGLNTRYIGNDSSLIMENCCLDVGAGVRHLREMGYENVVLVGNSGGGGLISMYQKQAESPSITHTPAGDPAELASAGLVPADGLILLMAHPGRALVYTEWLDPAVRDEADPFDRDPALDMFDAANGPPYSDEFIDRYRAAQVARNRRISAWVREQLDALPKRTNGRVDELPFVVHGTTADPRFLDVTIDPSDREAGTLWGDAYRANLMPSTLGHLTSYRSWLSQWSVDDSRSNGPRELPGVQSPVQVIYGTADQAAFPSHAHSLHDAVTHDDKELIAIEGATHYFKDQPTLLGECCDHIMRWLGEHDLL